MINAYDNMLTASREGLAKAAAEQSPAILAVLSEVCILKSKALETLSSGSNQESPAALALVGMADPMIQLLRQHSGNYNVVKAAAEVLTRAKAAGKSLPLSAFEVSRLSASPGILTPRCIRLPI